MTKGQAKIWLAVLSGLCLFQPSYVWGQPPPVVAIPRPPKEVADPTATAAVKAAETIAPGTKTSASQLSTTTPAKIFVDAGPRHVSPLAAKLMGLDGKPSPRHRHPDDPMRHRGIGEPLTGASWRNRPFHIDWFAGALIGDNLIDGAVGQNTKAFGGTRFGWDFDHYRSLELRLAFARLDTTASGGARGESDITFWDGHYLYYPLGDTHLRPFFSLGLGFSTFRFTDQNNNFRDETLFQLPIGMGLKYRWSRWLAIRGELMDNIAFGTSDIDGMHNLQLTIGMEMHFGGQPKSYYPFLNY